MRSSGIDMYEVARSVVEDRDVRVVHGVVWEGSDGRYWPFGIGLSLLAVPLYRGSRLVRRVVSVPPFAMRMGRLPLPLLLALVSVTTLRSLVVLGDTCEPRCSRRSVSLEVRSSSSTARRSPSDLSPRSW